jgi:hypothetical protein
MGPRRILFVSGSIDLGHVVRDLAIVRELRTLTAADVTWLAAAPADRVLREAGESLHPGSARLIKTGTSPDFPLEPESSAKQSEHVREGFRPCRVHRNERSLLLSAHRHNNKSFTLMKSAVSWWLSSGHWLKPAPTCDFNPAGATETKITIRVNGFS